MTCATTTVGGSGHFGELLQGRLGADGPLALVTLPAPGLRVTARFTPGPFALHCTGGERVIREIYSLAATVQPGNSGGPLLDTQGRVVGVIFAKSLEDDTTGYALTLAEAKPVLDASANAQLEVDTGACVAG